MIVIPNEGKTLLDEMSFADPSAITEDFVVDVYSNNYTPVNGSTGSDFTVATFTGYAQVSVPRASFGAAAIVANVAEITSSVIPTFSCSAGGGQTCYGWFMRGASSGKVYAAQLFSVARLLNAGASVLLNPFKLKLQTLH